MVEKEKEKQEKAKKIDLKREIDKTKEKISDIKEKISEVEGKVRFHVEEKPMQSVAIAFGAGLLAGAFITAIVKRKC